MFDQLKQEIISIYDKFDGLVNLSEFFDKNSFQYLLNFLLTDNEDLSFLNFDKLENDFTVEELKKNNIINLLWLLLAILRFPITKYNFTDKNIYKEIFNPESLFGKITKIILFFLIPDLSKPDANILWYPIKDGGQLLGYVCTYNNKYDNNVHKQSNTQFNVDIWSSPYDEEVCNRLVKRVKYSENIPFKQPLLVLLYSTRNHSFYISAIRESMLFGKTTITDKDLFVLKKQIKSINKNKLNKIESNEGKCNKLMSLISYYSPQISAMHAQICTNWIREALSLNHIRSAIFSMIPNLHLKWSYATIIFWEFNNNEFNFHRGLTYKKHNFLYDEYILDEIQDISALPYDFKNNIVSFFSSDLFSCELVDICQGAIDGIKIPKKILPINGEIPHLLPKSLLRLSYKNSPDDNLFIKGVLEIYFFEDIEWLKIYSDLFVDQITRLNILCRHFIEEIEKDRSLIIAQIGHTVRNWFSSIESQIRRVETTEERLQLINDIKKVHTLLTSSIALVKDRNDRKYMNQFQVEQYNYEKFYKLYKSIIHKISVDQNAKNRLFDVPNSNKNENFESYLMNLIEIKTFDGIEIKTVPLLMEAILTEVLLNSFEYFEKKYTLNKPINFKFTQSKNLIYLEITTKISKDDLKFLESKLKNKSVTGLGLNALLMYCELMSKVLNKSFTEHSIITEQNMGYAIYKLPLGIKIL